MANSLKDTLDEVLRNDDPNTEPDTADPETPDVVEGDDWDDDSVQRIQFTCPIDSSDNPEALQFISKADDSDPSEVVAIISTESVDSHGEIIAQAGLNWTRRYEASGKGMPVLSSHMRITQDGSPPIVGVVNRIWRTTIQHKGKSVKVTKASFRFIDTKVGKEWKAVYDGGGRVQTSIGGWSVLAEDIKNNDGRVIGRRHTKVELDEFSLVALGANPDTAIVKADETKELAAKLDGIADLIASLKKDLTTQITNIETRADAIEAALVSKALDLSQPTEPAKTEQPEVSEALNALINKIKGIAK